MILTSKAARVLAAVCCTALLASCGGGRDRLSSGGAVMRFSTGPLASACIQSDRKARNPAVCGCLQTVANLHLDRGEQRQAAKFFDDPHRAQEIRQSDKRHHEVFWRKYKAFGENVERSCRAYV